MKHAHAFLGGALLALLAAVPAWGQELAQERAVDVSGVWEITSETPRGTMTRKVTFEQDGSSLTGTMETRMGSVPIQNGSVEGNKISFTVVFSRGERSFVTPPRARIRHRAVKSSGRPRESPSSSGLTL